MLVIISDDKFSKVFVNLIDACIDRIKDAVRWNVGQEAYEKALDAIDLCEDLLEADGNSHPEIRVELDKATKRLEKAYDEFDKSFTEADDDL